MAALGVWALVGAFGEACGGALRVSVFFFSVSFLCFFLLFGFLLTALPRRYRRTSIPP